MAEGKKSLYRMTKLRLNDLAQRRPRQGRDVSGQPAIELAQAEREVAYPQLPRSSVEGCDGLLPGEATLVHEGLEQRLVHPHFHPRASPPCAWQSCDRKTTVRRRVDGRGIRRTTSSTSWATCAFT